DAPGSSTSCSSARRARLRRVRRTLSCTLRGGALRRRYEARLVAFGLPRWITSLRLCFAAAAIHHEGIDDEHVQDDGGDRPHGIGPRPRQLGDRVPEGGDDADDRGPTGACVDREACADLDGSPDEEEPTPRVEIR